MLGCPWEVVKELFALPVCVLFSYETVFISTYELSDFYHSDSLITLLGGVTKWLCDAELPAGVKP